jgi:3'-phosphoadenosine 5'-phosphosulfate sulfotransferase (PAPS reductase)/FAD synthetase
LKLGTKENPRHICGISGGKDSSALAIYIKNTRPEIFEKLELYFTDTGSELPEVYEYLEKMEQYLGKAILRIKADPNSDAKYKVVTGQDNSTPFDDYLKHYKGYLPSPNARWCTRVLKIKTMEEWIGDDYCISYVGIRADEPTREGYTAKGKNANITAVFPYREDGLVLQDIYDILENSGLGLPNYYKWRTRSGCYFCFYQRRVEWAILSLLYPEWFEAAKKYETTHADGRMYTWVKDKPLDYIAENAKDIIIRYIKKQYKKVQSKWLLTYTQEQMIELVNQGQLKTLIDSWDIKKLHDVDGENKEGCTVCAI